MPPPACSTKTHRIIAPRPHVDHLKKAGLVPWPSFQGNDQFVGTSPSGRVNVFVDGSLGAAALQNAKDLLADADRIVRFNDNVFGSAAGTVNVILFAMSGSTNGKGGADHNGCDYQIGQDIEVCVSYGNSSRCSGLFEAELSECAMNGNLCGYSTGEALSRWCANAVSKNALGDFATAPTWVANGYQDFVTTTDPSDQNSDSIGCGMVFISWLLSLGYSLPKIAQAMVQLGDTGKFETLYTALGGVGYALPNFTDAIAALPNGVQDDDPFAGVPAPAPPEPTPAPSPTPTPAPGSDEFKTQCTAFVLALADSTFSDRDAAWEGEKAVLAGFTAGVIDGPSSMTATKRLRKITG